MKCLFACSVHPHQPLSRHDGPLLTQLFLHLFRDLVRSQLPAI